MSNQTRELWEKLSQLQFLLHKRQFCRQTDPTADVTRGQGRILAFLKLRDGIRTRDLAYLLDIRISSLNELLAKLEKNGYITREPSQEDRRVMLVHLTETGRTEEQPESASDTLFSCLSPEDQSSFGSYLDRIIAALEAELGAASPTYRENCRRRNEAFERCFNGQSPMGGGRGQHGRCFRDGAGRGRHRHNEGPCR